VDPQNLSLATVALFGTPAAREVSVALNSILVDVFALGLKTKNVLWHVIGSNVCEDRTTLDEQADQLYAITDAIAERIHKLGGTINFPPTHFAITQRIRDNDTDYVAPSGMQAELCEDSKTVVVHMREVQVVCQKHNDVATTNMIERWIDETGNHTRLWLASDGRLWARL